MPYRRSDIIAYGPELCELARQSGKGVNESHLLVHRLLAEVFREDLTEVPQAALKAHLSSRLKQTLQSAA